MTRLSGGRSRWPRRGPARPAWRGAPSAAAGRQRDLVRDPSGSPSASATGTAAPTAGVPSAPAVAGRRRGCPGMPPCSTRTMFTPPTGPVVSPAIAHDPAYVYVPDTNSNDVYVIDQHTMQVVRHFAGGHEPQHVVPSYDLKTLYATADKPGFGSLTPIDPRTGKPGRPIPIDDAYNLYFTPNGRVRDRRAGGSTRRLAFYDPHTWKLHDVADDSLVRRHRPHGLHRRRHEVAGQLRVRQPAGGGRLVTHRCCRRSRCTRHATACRRTSSSPGRPDVLRRRHDGRRHLPRRCRHVPGDRFRAHRKRCARALHRARLAADVRHQPRRGHHQHRRSRHRGG